jgi:hypothetical protein
MRFRLVVLETPLPSVPRMVSGKVSATALPVAVTVITEETVAGLGLKMAVTPLGKPEALRVTEPEYPPEGLMVIVQDPVPPGWTTNLSQADKVKPEIVRVKFVDRGWFSLKPVMGTVKVPRTPNPFAFTVIIEEPVAGLGLKLKPTPLGTFEGPKLTAPEKPLIGLIVT